jgi:hypothetical protein
VTGPGRDLVVGVEQKSTEERGGRGDRRATQSKRSAASHDGIGIERELFENLHRARIGDARERRREQRAQLDARRIEHASHGERLVELAVDQEEQQRLLLEPGRREVGSRHRDRLAISTPRWRRVRGAGCARRGAGERAAEHHDGGGSADEIRARHEFAIVVMTRRGAACLRPPGEHRIALLPRRVRAPPQPCASLPARHGI